MAAAYIQSLPSNSELFLLKTIFRVLILFSVVIVFSACSTKTMTYNWERTKKAAYNAAVDPMTWAPLATGLALDATGYDDDITDHIIDSEKELFTEDKAHDLHDLAVFISYSTSLVMPDDDISSKLKRMLVQDFALAAGRTSVDIMNSQINKAYPRPIPDENDAIGSQHAVAPFLSSAITMRNLEQMNYLPNWSKYTISTITYAAATGSTYQRIQQGLHSVSDQLYSVMVGNFLGVFIHDAFLADDLNLSIQVSPEESKIVLDIAF